MPKSNIKFQNVQKKMPPKSVKLRHYSLYQQNSVKFCKYFTLDRIFFTPKLLARWYKFASLKTVPSSSPLVAICKILHEAQLVTSFGCWFGKCFINVIFKTESCQKCINKKWTLYFSLNLDILVIYYSLLHTSTSKNIPSRPKSIRMCYGISRKYRKEN